MVIGLYKKALDGSLNHAEILEVKKAVDCAMTEAKVLDHPQGAFTWLSKDIDYLEERV